MKLKLVIGKLFSQLLLLVLLTNFSASGLSMTSSKATYPVEEDTTFFFQESTKVPPIFSCEKDGLEETIEPFISCFLDFEAVTFYLKYIDFYTVYAEPIDRSAVIFSVPIWIYTRCIRI